MATRSQDCLETGQVSVACTGLYGVLRGIAFVTVCEDRQDRMRVVEGCGGWERLVEVVEGRRVCDGLLRLKAVGQCCGLFTVTENVLRWSVC